MSVTSFDGRDDLLDTLRESIVCTEAHRNAVQKLNSLTLIARVSPDM